jgi:hypothetical protein
MSFVLNSVNNISTVRTVDQNGKYITCTCAKDRDGYIRIITYNMTMCSVLDIDPTRNAIRMIISAQNYEMSFPNMYQDNFLTLSAKFSAAMTST